MPETFDHAATNPGSGGENLAGDRFTQDADTLFLPAAYLVFGAAGGPYTRVEAAAGLPARVMDGSGNQIVKFAPTEYTDADVDATPTGIGLVFRKESVNAMIFVGDDHPLPVDVQNAVAVTDNSGSLTVDDGLGSLTVDDGGASLTVDGVVGVQQGTGTAAGSNVSGSASSVTLLAANADRRLAVVYNDSSAVLYVKFGTTASATDFAYKLDSGDTLEVTHYTGRIDGIWASATGSARVTEVD